MHLGGSKWGRSFCGFLGRGGRGPVGTAHLAQQRSGFEPLTVGPFNGFSAPRRRRRRVSIPASRLNQPLLTVRVAQLVDSPHSFVDLPIPYR